MPKTSAAVLKRNFLKRIRKNKKGCWVWTGARFNTGYGQIRRGKKILTTHRVSWEIHNGPVPEGQNVLHRCDNRPCINPDHLFLGSIGDNNRDCQAKGRRHNVKGSNHGKAKMTEAQVRRLRKMQDAGSSFAFLAVHFGIDTRTVKDIVSRRTWRHC